MLIRQGKHGEKGRNDATISAMRLLITGGSGLVGRYVVDELGKSHSVDILDIITPRNGKYRHHRVDILDLDALRRVVRDYDAVVHLAGIPHPLDNPAETVFRVNTL